jgi:hypothetical protein
MKRMTTSFNTILEGSNKRFRGTEEVHEVELFRASNSRVGGRGTRHVRRLGGRKPPAAPDRAVFQVFNEEG